jgi:hypothetical protein
MGLIIMSDKELSRLKVIQNLTAREMKPRHAAQLLGLTTRQVRRLRKRFLEHGASGLASRQRGKPSNRTTPPHVRKKAMELLRTH